MCSRAGAALTADTLAFGAPKVGGGVTFVAGFVQFVEIRRRRFTRWPWAVFEETDDWPDVGNDGWYRSISSEKFPAEASRPPKRLPGLARWFLAGARCVSEFWVHSVTHSEVMMS